MESSQQPAALHGAEILDRFAGRAVGVTGLDLDITAAMPERAKSLYRPGAG
ncbi:MAG TPA: hypothetical protein VKU93_01900 [Terracidiphilus sp.]|nr:hypothetical protein [Terracidiphilus sp.]